MEAGSMAGAGAWGRVEARATMEAKGMMRNSIVAGIRRFGSGGARRDEGLGVMISVFVIASR